MVKGISRQVIVVRSPDPKLFEQAIFILREDAKEVTDAQLLKEAKRAAASPAVRCWKKLVGPAWAMAGAAVMGAVWWVCGLL